ncbi:MAG: PPC domain-containing protein, partial [Armatimonadetes bacterium]|nr:PPC domain-containing protein [Armatimonadota bacterium]
RAEVEPNNTVRDVQRIAPPVIINGLISRPGDVDVFRFEGRAGEEVVAEVYARRLGSPLDSLLRLTDASGRVLAWNDDHEDREARLLTHHADSYLSTRLPKTGTYFVRLADSQQHGGDSYAYRLRVGPRRPDFAVRVTPSSANMRGLPVAPLCVHVLRRDGFNDEIEVVLKDAPPGFTLSGGRVPSGRDSVRITLAAPPRQIDGPVALQLEARARIGGTMVVRPVVPADDMMQAFAYRHLVPARELLVAIGGAARYAPPIGLADAGPVRIPVGGTAQVRVNAPRRPALSAIRLELFEPPKGVILEDVTVEPDGLTLVLKADAGAPKAGYADNLIVEAFTEMAGGPQNGRAANRGRRLSLGVLPAIPFEIIQR